MDSIWNTIASELPQHLHGELTAFAVTGPGDSSGYEHGVLILDRGDNAPLGYERRFSVHRWALPDEGDFYLYGGEYDLTHEQAAKEYVELVLNGPTLNRGW